MPPDLYILPRYVVNRRRVGQYSLVAICIEKESESCAIYHAHRNQSVSVRLVVDHLRQYLRNLRTPSARINKYRHVRVVFPIAGWVVKCLVRNVNNFL